MDWIDDHFELKGRLKSDKNLHLHILDKAFGNDTLRG